MQQVLVAVCLALVPAVAVASEQPVTKRSEQPVTEREKFEAEQAFRNRQHEAEQAYRRTQLEQAKLDLELRRKQQSQEWWYSPLMLAILGAIVAALAQVFVAWWNAKNLLATEKQKAADQIALEDKKATAQRELEAEKARAQRVLDAQQAESDRILEVVKTGGNTEAAATNLKFLLDAGLVTSPTLAKRMTKWLATPRKEGEGPSLPSADGRFHFARKGGLPKVAQTALADTLNRFLTYLDEIGFKRSEKSVRIQSIDEGESHYVAGKVMLSQSDRHDPRTACELYSHHVLTTVPSFKDQMPQVPEVRGVEVGLAGYFPSSFLDAPHFWYLRSPDEVTTYTSFTKAGELMHDDVYRDGAIWGELFWRIRSTTGAPIADRLMQTAWVQVQWPEDRPYTRDAFLKSLLSAAIVAGVADKVRGVLAVWRYPVHGELKSSPQRKSRAQPTVPRKSRQSTQKSSSGTN